MLWVECGFIYLHCSNTGVREAYPGKQDIKQFLNSLPESSPLTTQELRDLKVHKAPTWLL